MIPVGVQLVGRPPARLQFASARFLDWTGASSLWMYDHWMSFVPLDIYERSRFPVARLVRNPEDSFDAFAFLGALSQRTRKASIGVSVTEAIRRHPVQIAQAALSIHHMSRGRFILAMGAGERENIEPYGLSYSGQASRLEEALYLIRLLWKSDGYVSHRGRFFTIDRGIMGLGAYRGTFPPIWVAAHGPKTLRTAGRYGDGWLPTHQMEPDEYADRLAAIRSAAEEAGRSFRRFTPAYEMRALLASSHEQAHRLLDSPALRLGALIVPSEVWAKAGASHPLGESYRGIADWIPSHEDPEEVLALMEKVPFEVLHTAFDHGTWQQLAARILSYRAVGLRHIVIAGLTPLVDPRLTPAFFRDLARLIRALRSA